jgi:hypothetical protein
MKRPPFESPLPFAFARKRLLRRAAPWGAAAWLLALAGCAVFSDATDAVRERLAGRDDAHVRTFSASPRATYDALRLAAEQMGYRFLRGGPAQGVLEAVNAVRAGDTHGSARQWHLRARLQAAREGPGTDLTVRLTEVLERDSSNRPGHATETPLRDTPQYDVLFRRIETLLHSPAPPAAP